jgi:hypothetical protein
VANEAGWVLLNPVTFEATWSGGRSPSSVKIEPLGEGARKTVVSSDFGYGIVTWSVPFLFRTPRGYNLFVRGPANWPKDGACALDGVVETDWSVATFTMNWKLTRPNHPVVFEADEPFCMLVPQRRGKLESFLPEFRDMEPGSELHTRHNAWAGVRNRTMARKFLDAYARDLEGARKRWDRHYFKGTTPDAPETAEHQTKLNLREFAESQSPAVRHEPGRLNQ